MCMCYFKLSGKHGCCLYRARLEKGNTCTMWDYTTILWIYVMETVELILDRELISCVGQNGVIICKDYCEPRYD